MGGLFDGEGSLYFGSGLRVKVSNTYLPILILLQDRYGGQVYRRKEKTGPTSRTMYDWSLNGSYAVEFLLRIREHLIEKRIQADLALAARFYPPSSEMFRALNEKLKAQKRIDHG